MRLPGLDLLRAIAIVWVMLFHSFIVGGLGDGWQWLSRYGWMGVDLFFVLSGFLIGSQVLGPLARGGCLSFRDFYLRRAFRILPAFWVVLALYTLLPEWREVPGMEPWWKFAGFFMNLSIDYSANQAFSHAWSLCVEEHFYLLFPGLAWLLLRRPSMAKFIVVCTAIVLAGIGLRSAVWLHDTALAPPRNWFIEDIYYPTWCRLDGLLMGVVLAGMKVFRPEWWTRLSARTNGILLAGLVTVALAFWLFRERTGLLGNSIGWPVLSAGLGLLVFVRRAAQRLDRAKGDPWHGVAGGGLLQPVPEPQDRLPPGRFCLGRSTGRTRDRRVRGLCGRNARGWGIVALHGGAPVPEVACAVAGSRGRAQRAAGRSGLRTAALSEMRGIASHSRVPALGPSFPPSRG